MTLKKKGIKKSLDWICFKCVIEQLNNFLFNFY